MPGGGGEGGGEGGGGGGATAQRAAAARAMGGIGTQSNVITIDARGQSPERIAAALTTSLATLARTRVASGVLS